MAPFFFSVGGNGDGSSPETRVSKSNEPGASAALSSHWRVASVFELYNKAQIFQVLHNDTKLHTECTNESFCPILGQISIFQKVPWTVPEICSNSGFFSRGGIIVSRILHVCEGCGDIFQCMHTLRLGLFANTGSVSDEVSQPKQSLRPPEGI